MDFGQDCFAFKRDIKKLVQIFTACWVNCVIQFGIETCFTLLLGILREIDNGKHKFLQYFFLSFSTLQNSPA